MLETSNMDILTCFREQNGRASLAQLREKTGLPYGVIVAQLIKLYQDGSLIRA